MKNKQEQISDQLFDFQSKQIGVLEVTSGNIIACDPLTGNGRPFEKKIAAGKYPVQIFFRDEDDTTISYVAIQFRDELWLPHTLEMATTEGQRIETLEEGETFGYPVDAGMSCFADKDAFSAMENNSEKFDNYYDEVIAKEMEANGNTDFLDHKPNKDKNANVILFRSGYGDGVYASYWGYNKAGELSCLVTDFAVHSLSEVSDDEGSYDED